MTVPARSIAVVYDDRADCLIGAQIAAASLRRHCPDLSIVVWTPGLEQQLTAFAERHRMSQRGDRPMLEGWSVKPSVLLDLLEEHEVVYWLDSDIVVTADVRRGLPAAPDVFVSTEDTSWGQRPGSAERREAWGLPPGRDLDVTVNTGFIRVSRTHRALLSAWSAMLSTPAYQHAQASAAMTRPMHLLSDQEVLTALLGSAPWADLRLHLLRRGWDIAQCFGPDGFTWRERLHVVRRRHVPPLVHAMGHKPWLRPQQPGLRAAYDRLHCDLSPYTGLALRQGDVVAETGWQPRDPTPVRALKRLVPDPLLQELPLCIVDAVARSARRRWGIGRFPAAVPSPSGGSGDSPGQTCTSSDD